MLQIALIVSLYEVLLLRVLRIAKLIFLFKFALQFLEFLQIFVIFDYFTLYLLDFLLRHLHCILADLLEPFNPGLLLVHSDLCLHQLLRYFEVIIGC